ncbi:MAG TPA: hypothetical protein VGM19_04750 [Armatimonadota bacterium]|jgi:membrane protein implicated in regulation of membrane protease activity
MKRLNDFNTKLAVIIANATGNMFFFWAALLFCVILRALYPPKLPELLLNLENDLQLLLLAVNAVVGAALYANQMKQLANQDQVLSGQDAMLAKIEAVLARLETEEEHLMQEEDEEAQTLQHLTGHGEPGEPENAPT